GPVFHTIVSIKNDGHYFCRAGGNRPDGLNEPVTLNHQRAWDILSDTYEDMKRLNLGGTDQFFHCMAFCRVSKLNDAGVSRSAKGLGYEKEIRDYGLNLFGMYGRKVKLSHSEMIEDNKKDLAVNDHGLTCPSTTDCSDRCSDYINPEHKKTIKALQDAGYLK
ncbi:hypothetical protein ACRW29_20610, partial [Escherichia coli]|uniref:hypothetical protein n=2 Tax=Escherichia coli TaxID=562 RepID=UPI001FF4A330